MPWVSHNRLAVRPSEQACKPCKPGPGSPKTCNSAPTVPCPRPSFIKTKTSAALHCTVQMSVRARNAYLGGQRSKTTLPRHPYRSSRGVNMCVDAPIQDVVVTLPGPLRFLSPASARVTGHLDRSRRQVTNYCRYIAGTSRRALPGSSLGGTESAIASIRQVAVPCPSRNCPTSASAVRVRVY